MGVTHACTCAYKTVSLFLLVDVPHHAIRDKGMLCAWHIKELFTRGPYHFIAGGVFC